MWKVYKIQKINRSGYRQEINGELILEYDGFL